MANEFILSGDDMELMGAGFFRRLKRKAIRSHDPLYQFRRAKKKVSRFSGDDGDEMGAGFWKRQARRTSKIVRPLTHQALNIAAKVPGYGAGVSAARGFAAKLSTPKKAVTVPGSIVPVTPAAKGSNLPLILGAVALAGGGIFLATRGKKQRG